MAIKRDVVGGLDAGEPDRFDRGAPPSATPALLKGLDRFGWLIVAASCVALIGWAALILAPDAFESLSRENGVVEWIGTLLFLGASGMFFVLAVRLARSGSSAPHRRARVVMAVLLGLLFALAFLEEISWGQQIFDWGTPETFGANIQSETNLHNFSRFDCHSGCSGTLILRDADGRIVFDLQRIFTFGILALAVLVPVLARWSRVARRPIAAIGIPVATLAVAGWTVANLVLSRGALLLADPGDEWIAREYMEAMWGGAAFLVALLAQPTVERFYARLGSGTASSASQRDSVAEGSAPAAT